MVELSKTLKTVLRSRKALQKPLYVTHLSVEGLFNKINYPKIDLWGSADRSSRISVIYGDNGTGKTNILRLLYACLSPQPHAGLRTLIAQTPFKSFSVNFSDGSDIIITKPEPMGGFQVSVRNGNTRTNFDIKANPDGRVIEQEAVTSLEEALKKIGFDILFVDHNRVVQSTYSFLAELPVPPNEITARWGESLSRLYDAEVARHSYRLKESDLQFPLQQVVAAVERWVRNEAFKQGATGEQNAAAVYLEIARALSGRTEDIEDFELDEVDIVAILQELRYMTESYIKHGLLSNYPFDELIKIYRSSKESNRDQIERVLKPFLDSVHRRLTALSNVHEIITVFENELNSYFKDKTASFHILEGLTIRDNKSELHPNKSKLNLDDLSSGEKQLVFLLGSAVVSRSNRSLIIIDEPESSLNYKWQRLVAGSLSKISLSSNTQFILASHSIEIITRYVNSSVELVGG